MKRTGEWMLLAAGVVIIVSLAAPAIRGQEEVADEQAYLDLGKAHAQVDYALRVSREIMDYGQSGWQAAYDSMQQDLQEANNILNTVENKERRKPQEKQDQGFLDECRRQREEMGQIWPRFDLEVRMPLRVRYDRARQMYGEANQAVQYVTQLEQQWKNSNFGPREITPLYQAINERARAAKAMGDAAFAELKEQGKQWTDRRRKAEEFAKSQLPE